MNSEIEIYIFQRVKIMIIAIYVIYFLLFFKWFHSDDEDYQLVTWSKDQSLRIWRVDSSLQKVNRKFQLKLFEVLNFLIF